METLHIVAVHEDLPIRDYRPAQRQLRGIEHERLVCLVAAAFRDLKPTGADQGAEASGKRTQHSVFIDGSGGLDMTVEHACGLGDGPVPVRRHGIESCVEVIQQRGDKSRSLGKVVDHVCV
ncbi:Uncharacterised protein [Mycobacteroides abscessus subsp. abscessus]|nr:Uncharacterised protein [Mycobacteroides abscessus subsp. abscessus]